jgi:Tfp pilus assembly protein FimV
MSDRYDDDGFDEMEGRRARSRRSRSSRAPAAILLLLACGMAAVVLRQNFGGLVTLYQVGSTQSSTPVTQAPASDSMTQPVEELRQMVKDLGASLQQATDKLEVTQRQLAAEQGERKLLSEQVGALSARVSALSTSNASVSPAAGPSLLKRKPTPAPTPTLR